MLSGGMVGQFHDPSQGNPTKVLKPQLELKGAGLDFSLFLYFGANGMIVSRSFDGLALPSIRGPFFNALDLPNTTPPTKIRTIPGPRFFLRHSFTTLW